jgi:putative FmdB family regulatory protein
MPIYAYKCTSCGHAQDVLQKISDPLLTQCPVCAAATFTKQLTAAGFQLKGSGWYATDFRNNGSAPAVAAEGDTKPKSDQPADSQAGEKATDKASDKAGDKTSATPAAAPASAPSASSSPASPAAPPAAA